MSGVSEDVHPIQCVRDDEGPSELWLCEAHSVILRPNVTYIFRVYEGCKKCKELADAYPGEQRE